MYWIVRLILWPIQVFVRLFRPMLACTLGYILIAAGGALAMYGAGTLLGTEWLLQTESWQVSADWIAISIVAALIGPFIGGVCCQIMDRRGGGLKMLLLVILILGAIGLMNGHALPEVRPEDPTLSQVYKNAIIPIWAKVLLPLQSALVAFSAARAFKHRIQDRAKSADTP